MIHYSYAFESKIKIDSLAPATDRNHYVMEMMKNRAAPLD